MNVSNLKKLMCPMDGEKLVKNSLAGFFKCPKCHWSCTYRKFEELLVGPTEARPKPTYYPGGDDNIAELNNLSLDEVSDDFSDSPFLNN